MTAKKWPIICGGKQRKSPEIVRFQDLSGGDKRDRTADLMTASCDRFVILSLFASNPSVPSAKSAELYNALRIASTRFRAHLGQNLGQAITLLLTKSRHVLPSHRLKSRRSQVFSDKNNLKHI